MAREVLPYVPDAWVEPRKQKKGQLLELRDGGTVGYEIPFTRLFYERTKLRSLEEISKELYTTMDEIRILLDEVKL